MKSSKSKWFNPTEDSLWDEYYTVTWRILGLFLMALAALVIATIIRSKI